MSNHFSPDPARRQPDIRQHPGTARQPQAHHPAQRPHQVSSHVSAHERELLLKGIETAKIKAETMAQQGYRFSLSQPDGRACLPGIVCIRKPEEAAAPKDAPAFYLVAITQANPFDASCPWEATCDCEFHRRTELAFGQGKGTCKHAIWILKLFNAHLAMMPFVAHILHRSEVMRQNPYPASTPPETAEQTAKVFERPRFAVATQDRQDRQDRQTVPVSTTPPARRVVPGSERDF